MDMRKYLKRWLTFASLETMGGSYEGEIVTVVAENLRNKFTTGREAHPVISFHDGWRLGLNLGMREDLVAVFGPDTDAWIGARLRVFTRPMSDRDPDDERPVRYEKAVASLTAPTLDDADNPSSLGASDASRSVFPPAETVAARPFG